MTRIISPLLIGASTGAVADAGATLLEHQSVGVVTAVSIACFVGTFCMWIAHKFEKQDRDLKIHNLQLASELSTYHVQVAERLARIEQSIEDLPCSNCTPKKTHV
jgi:hypothetical protein